MNCKDCKFYSTHTTNTVGCGDCDKLYDSQFDRDLLVIMYSDSGVNIEVKEDFGCKMFENK